MKTRKRFFVYIIYDPRPGKRSERQAARVPTAEDCHRPGEAQAEDERHGDRDRAGQPHAAHCPAGIICAVVGVGCCHSSKIAQPRAKRPVEPRSSK